WRMAFLVNLPFLAVAYVATFRYVPESRDEGSTGHFDSLGSLVIALAVGGLAFGTIRGQQHGWGEPAAIASLAIGVLAAVAFPFLGIVMIGTRGYNEQAAGIAGVPGTLFLVFFSTRFGTLASRFGPRLFMAVGPAVMALGILWLARIPSTSAPWILGTGSSSSILPPGDYFVDLLPGLV